MTKIGSNNRLRVSRAVDFGVYLDGVDLGDILLPRRYVPANSQIGDELEVFVYVDSDDRLIATTEKPKVQVGECAYLKVVAVNSIGAFLDWGLPKDLLVPFSEQQQRMEVDRFYTVYVYCDEQTDRIAASSKLNNYLHETVQTGNTITTLRSQQRVNLLICAKTDLGFKAVINNHSLGIIFNADVLQPLRSGQQLQGFIKEIRDDGKINLCLQLQNQAARDELAEKILQHLASNKGESTLTDKSSPEAIFRQYRVSKASYKKAIGNLFKQKKIMIDASRIVLNS